MKQLPLTSSTPRYSVTVTILGVSVVWAMTWLNTTKRWVASLSTPDGRSIVDGVTITPGAPLSIPASHPDLPPGRYVCLGPDSYGQNDLGSQVVVLFVSHDEANKG